MNNNTKKYKQMFSIVRDELNRVDPIGVVGDNENLVDEYDIENQAILTHIGKCSDHIELSEIMADIFTKYIGSPYTPQEFEECAKNILDRIKNI